MSKRIGYCILNQSTSWHSEANSSLKLEDGAILLEVIVVALLLFFMVIAGNRLLGHYMQSYQQLLSLQQALTKEQNRR